MRPTVSCARWSRKRTRAYRSHRIHPAFPAQWFYGLLRALPGEPGFFATVAPEKLSLPRNLTPASGCQDHTTSPSASGALVSSTIRVHRIPPRVDDVAQRPFGGTGRRTYRMDFSFCKTEYFFGKGLTGGRHKPVSDLPVGQPVRPAMSFRGAQGANPESRNSGSGPADHPGMTRGDHSPVRAEKLQRLLARREAAKLAIIRIVLGRLR